MKKNSFVPFYIAMAIVSIYTLGHQIIIGHRTGMIAMNDFMGVRFLLFGIIKLFDLKWFISAYIKYDIIAKRRKPYGYIFPFLEIFLWLAYILDSQMNYWIVINGATLLLVAITGIGIFNSLKKKEAIDCVCMWTTFPLPMSKINLRENISMGIMAACMLIWMLIMPIGQINANTIQDNANTEVICH